MLRHIFNQYKNRQSLKAFEVKEGRDKGYLLTLEISRREFKPSNTFHNLNSKVKELPWMTRLSMATQDELVSAHNILKTFEESAYESTGKAFDVFVKPDGAQDYQGVMSLSLGLMPGNHQILLLPKGEMPRDGIVTMINREPLREATGVIRARKSSLG